MPKISIIVPVYKVEKYLDRCVESILAQTFSDFEVILIDDGSPDDCPVMCDEWAKNDARIRVIHQSNHGQAAARNRALDVAEGNYICFIDSDDYVHPKFLEILYNNLISSNADVSVCSYKRTNKSNDVNNVNNNSLKYSGVDFVKKGLVGDIPCGVWLLWDKLFKKECFDNVRLPIGRINEDNATVYKILYEAKTVVATDAVLYYYFENTNSTVLQKFSKKHLDWLLVPQEMIEYFTKHNDQLLVDKCNKMYLHSLEDMYKKVCLHLNDKELEKDLRKRLIAQYKSEKKKYPITVKTHTSLFEALYPNRMKIHWYLVAVKNKLIKR